MTNATMHPIFIKYTLEYIVERLGGEVTYLALVRANQRKASDQFRRHASSEFQQPVDELFLPEITTMED